MYWSYPIVEVSFYYNFGVLGSNFKLGFSFKGASSNLGVILGRDSISDRGAMALQMLICF